MSDEKRRSERVIPMVSDEEMVVIDAGEQRFLAKLMDLSDSGTLLYQLSEDAIAFKPDPEYRLSFYHQGKVFSAPATVARANGHLVAFRFTSLGRSVAADLQAKLIRMEVEWARLRTLI